MRLLLPILMFTLASCSVYKSRVRQQFEDNSPDYVTKSLPGECRRAGPVQAWFERAFPRGPAELLVSEADLEIWKTSLDDGHVLLRADRAGESGLESCALTYDDESDWMKNRRAYLEFFGVSQPD